ncbi:MAG: hypothetical protein IPH62_09630 [Ignavibacteriae bacterium]|nr:hypothetical protein [Ignavibacteriota bacterium]
MSKPQLQKKLKAKRIDDKSFLNICRSYIKSKYSFYTISDSTASELPINAFSYNQNKLFKILKSASNAKILEEITNDLNNVSSSKLEIEKVVYFAQNNIYSDPKTLEQIRNKVYSKLPFEIISLHQILLSLNKSSSLNSLTLVPRNSLHDLYSSEYSYVEDEQSVISDIFNYIFNSTEKIVFERPTEIRLQKLMRKINKNFVDNFAITVKNMFNVNWRYILSVEAYITDQIVIDDRHILATYNKIRNEYIMLAKIPDYECPVNDPRHIITIAKSIIPQDKSHSETYFSSANAIVLYFFEMCDFGNKYEGEQLSFIQQFNDRNK